VSDRNPIRRKEYIAVEMMFENLISVKNCKYCRSGNPETNLSSKNPPTAAAVVDQGATRNPAADEMCDGLHRLSPIIAVPIALVAAAVTLKAKG